MLLLVLCLFLLLYAVTVAVRGLLLQNFVGKHYHLYIKASVLVNSQNTENSRKDKDEAFMVVVVDGRQNGALFNSF